MSLKPLQQVVFDLSKQMTSNMLTVVFFSQIDQNLGKRLITFILYLVQPMCPSVSSVEQHAPTHTIQVLTKESKRWTKR